MSLSYLLDALRSSNAAPAAVTAAPTRDALTLAIGAATAVPHGHPATVQRFAQQPTRIYQPLVRIAS